MHFCYIMDIGIGFLMPLFYDVTKSLGFCPGSKRVYCPLGMKKALCKKKNHWDKYTDVIYEPINKTG